MGALDELDAIVGDVPPPAQGQAPATGGSALAELDAILPKRADVAEYAGKERWAEMIPYVGPAVGLERQRITRNAALVAAGEQQEPTPAIVPFQAAGVPAGVNPLTRRMTPESAQGILAKDAAYNEMMERGLTPGAQILQGGAKMVGYATEIAGGGGMATLTRGAARKGLMAIPGIAVAAGKRGIAGTLTRAGIKVAGRVAGETARSLITPSALAGNYEDRTRQGQGPGTALAGAFLDTVIGNVAEQSGEAVLGVAAKIGAKIPVIGKAVTLINGGLRKAWAKAGFSAGAFDAAMKAGGWNGVIAELTEERVEPFLKAVFQGDEWRKIIPSLEQLGVEAAVLSLPMAPGIAMGTMRNAAGRAKAKAEVKKEMDRFVHDAIAKGLGEEVAPPPPQEEAPPALDEAQQAAMAEALALEKQGVAAPTAAEELDQITAAPPAVEAPPQTAPTAPETTPTAPEMPAKEAGAQPVVSEALQEPATQQGPSPATTGEIAAQAPTTERARVHAEFRQSFANLAPAEQESTLAIADAMVFATARASGIDSEDVWKRLNFAEGVATAPATTTEGMAALKKKGLKAVAVTELADSLNATVRALDAPTVDEAMHELGHVGMVWLPTDVRKQAETWAGAKYGKWDVPTKEKFANAFVEWLNGRARAPKGLARVFSDLKKWLTKVFGSLRAVQGLEKQEAIERVFKFLTGEEAGKGAAAQAGPKGESLFAVRDPWELTKEDYVAEGSYGLQQAVFTQAFNQAIKDEYMSAEKDRGKVMRPHKIATVGDALAPEVLALFPRESHGVEIWVASRLNDESFSGFAIGGPTEAGAYRIVMHPQQAAARYVPGLMHELKHLTDILAGKETTPTDAIRRESYAAYRRLPSERRARRFEKSMNNAYVHRLFIERAIEQGRQIPPDVLADYPDLAGKGAAAGAGGKQTLFATRPATNESERDRMAPVWYSKLSQAVDTKMGGRATPQQLMGMLKGAGVKDEEIEWSGLPELLKGKGSVTKAEVQEHLEANAIQVVDVVKGGRPSGEPQWAVVDEDGQPRFSRRFDTEDEAWDYAERYQGEDEPPLDVEQVPGTEAPATKFSQYQAVPGGENYRELLLQMPAAKKAIALEPTVPFNGTGVAYQDGSRQVQGVTTTPWTIGSEHGTITYWPYRYDWSAQRTGAEYVVDSEKMQNAHFKTMEAAVAAIEKSYAGTQRGEDMGAYRSDVFTGQHWSEPNVLAHVRTSDFTDARGKRVLVIQEIQSDWHQEGREKGYGGANVLTKQDAESLGYSVRRSASSRGGSAYFLDGPNLPRGTTNYIGFETEAEAWDTLVAKLRAQMSENAVPNAPFKSTWPTLAMKRMIRWGAENGYDRIAWSTGAQQADVYSLATAVDKLTWNPSDERPGGKYVYGTKVGQGEVVGMGVDEQGNIVNASMDELNGKHLSDAIGKEMAARVMAEPRGELSGEGLKVGGHGMRAFYDQMLVNETNKLVKRYGARVGEVKLLTMDSPVGPFPLDIEVRGGKYWVVDSNRARASEDFGSYQEADAQRQSIMAAAADAAKGRGRTTVHGFDITPAMRDEALGKGMSLFATRPDEEGRPKGVPVPALAMAITRGRAYLDDGVTDFRKWAGAMVGVYTENIKPYLAPIYEALRTEGTHADAMTPRENIRIPRSPKAGKAPGTAKLVTPEGGTPRVALGPRPTPSGAAYLAGLGTSEEARAGVDVLDTEREERRRVSQQIAMLINQRKKFEDGAPEAVTIDERLEKLRERENALTLGGQVPAYAQTPLKPLEDAADARVAADPVAERARIVGMAAANQVPEAVDTYIMDRLVDQIIPEVLTADPAEVPNITIFYDSVRKLRGNVGLVFRTMQDKKLSPAQRRLRAISEAIAFPAKPWLDKMAAAEKAGNMALVAQLRKQRDEELIAFRAILAKHGVDPKNLGKLSKDRRKAAAIHREMITSRSGGWDVVQELYRNILLSGTPTHSANFFSNSAFFAYHFGIRESLTALWNSATGAKEGTHLSDLKHMLDFTSTLGPAIADAYRNAIETFVTEIPTMEELHGEEGQAKFVEGGVAIAGKKGRAIRYPQRWLMAMDDFAVTLAARIKVAMVAHRMAVNEGFKGAELTERMQALIADPVSPAWKKAIELSQEVTFKGKPDPFAQWVINIRKKHRWAYFSFPFITTPAHIAVTGMKMSPYRLLRHLALPYTAGVAAITGDWSRVKNSLAGHKIAADLISAGLLWLIIGQDDDDPWITGKDGINGQNRYSIKIAGQWWSYYRIEPFATALAATVDLGRGIKSGDPSVAVREGSMGFLQQMGDKTYFQGIQDLYRAVGEPVAGRADLVDSLATYASRFASSWVPNFIKAPARALQATIKERRAYGKPGTRAGLLLGQRALQQAELAPGLDHPRYDMWGRPMLRDGSPWNYAATDFLWRMIAPAQVGKTQPYVGDVMVYNWNRLHPMDEFHPRPPDRSLTWRGKKAYMDDATYEKFMQEVGTRTKAGFDAWFAVAERYGATLDPQNPSPEMKNQLESIRERATNAARAVVIRMMAERGELK